MPLYGAFQPRVLALCTVPYGLRHNTLIQACWLKAADVCFCQRHLKKMIPISQVSYKLCTLVMETVGHIQIILIQETYSNTHVYRCHTHQSFNNLFGGSAPWMMAQRSTVWAWVWQTLFKVEEHCLRAVSEHLSVTLPKLFTCTRGCYEALSHYRYYKILD